MQVEAHHIGNHLAIRDEHGHVAGCDAREVRSEALDARGREEHRPDDMSGFHQPGDGDVALDDEQLVGFVPPPERLVVQRPVVDEPIVGGIIDDDRHDELIERRPDRRRRTP